MQIQTHKASGENRSPIIAWTLIVNVLLRRQMTSRAEVKAGRREWRYAGQ